MKKPTLPIGNAAGRALAELAVIVAGVLIALAAQSWWEDRQLEYDQSRILVSMEADLVSMRSGLERRLEDTDSARTAIRWILDPTTDLESAPDSTLLTNVRLALWEINGGEPEFPTYDEVQGSGRVELLPDTVRSALRPVLTLREDLRGRSQDIFQYQVGNLDPWLLDNLGLRDVLHWDDPELASGERDRPTPAILRSRRVENMLLAKLQLVGLLRDRVASGLEKVDQALGVVRNARGS